MKDVSQANTGSIVKISAVWVAGVNRWAQAWTVKSTAVLKMPVSSTVAMTVGEGSKRGCSRIGVVAAMKVAAVAICKTAICSKGKRWLARPNRMIWKAKAKAQPMLS